MPPPPDAAPTRARIDPRPLAGAVAVATVGVLPVFLTGAMAVQMRADLGFGATALGSAVAVFFATGALTSAVAGRVSEALGPGTAMRVAAAGSVVAACVAALAPRYGVLVAALVLGGLANAVAQPAANLYIARAVAGDRLGLSLGVKQSAVPAATLLGGLAVPAVALTVGWRWAFAAAAAAGAVVAAAGPGRRLPAPTTGPAPSLRGPALRPLVVLSVGCGLGAAAAGSLAAFLVSGGVHAGLGEGPSGLLFAAGSATGLTVRLIAGARADVRGGRHLPVVAAMLALGAGGYLLLAAGAPALYVLGTPVAFGAGWAWPGLFHLAIVRNHIAAPAAATGITQTGVYVGGMAGPVLFGLVVETAGYGPAWLAAGVTSLAAALVVVAGRRLLVREVAARPAPAT